MDFDPTPAALRHRLRLLLRRRWPLVAMVAIAMGAIVVAGTLAWRSAPDKPATAAASPTSGPSHGVPGATDGAGAGGAPASLSPGVPLDVAGQAAIAELSADEAPNGVVDPGSGFRLTSLDGTPAAALAARLVVEPPIRFEVAAGADGREARIAPTERLASGTVYRFVLTTEDGRPLDSWAFQTHRPLQVVGTLPGNTETGVPLDTGIEVTFDQDGVVDAADHVSFEPAVEGRFEQHGRVLSFVPERPLRPATAYTVTVSEGVPVDATGERLEADVVFRFETAAALGSAPITYRFADDVVESRPDEPATIALWAFQESSGDDEPKPPTSIPIEIYRFPDLAAAVVAFGQVRNAPDWTRWSSPVVVPTGGLTRVAAFDADLRDSDGLLWFLTPDALPRGEYLVHLASPTRPIQAILQVTDIAGYLAVSDTATLVWANDLRTGGPLAGATVRAEGVSLGRTGPDGSLLGDTPRDLLPSEETPCDAPCAPVVVVQDGERSLFLPATGARQTDGKGLLDGGSWERTSDYWRVFDTDRSTYRRTDTIGAWGVVRHRDTGAVPPTVTLRLFGDEVSADGPPIATVDVHPNDVGAFTGTIPLVDLPEATYRIEVHAGTAFVAETSVQVARIHKPGYRLELATGRRVYIQGDRIRVTAQASFYEGSPVPGLPIELDGLVNGSVATDAAGAATLRGTARFDEDDQGEDARVAAVEARPDRAEEGDIVGSSPQVLVFPSMWVLDATATSDDDRIVVRGGLHAVDRDRLEREIADRGDLWGLDPAGEAIAGARVTATFIEIIPRRIQRGTVYDFVQKRAVPVWDYETTEREAGTVRIRTGRSGRFTAEIPASGKGHSYMVRLAATDPDGHKARRLTYVDEPGAPGTEQTAPTLDRTTASDSDEYGIGDPIDLTMADPTTPTSDTDRYLFLTAQRGLRDAVVQESPRYRANFDKAAAPGVAIIGVRFTGDRFIASPAFTATFRAADRAIRVGLATDARRYAPGDDVTLTLTTRDGSGDPVPSSVALRVVDEKLFGIDGGEAADPLAELYASVGSGVRAVYQSHRPPLQDYGSGDTTGGGRDDFRDVALFRSVDTGPDGRATVTFDIPDDLTSWRVSAAAFASGLRTGEGFVLVPVGLPFFVDASIASEYLVSDRPEIALRAFGSALEADDRVTFQVDSDSLGLHRAGLTGRAFETLGVALPRLSAGTHAITITARTGSGAGARTDRLTRTFSVIPSRLTRTRTTSTIVDERIGLEGGDDLTEVVVADAGSARYAPLLVGLAAGGSARLEDALAASLADALLERRFSGAGGVDAAETFDGSAYQVADGGLAILPYASSDLEASVLASIVAPERFDRPRLEGYLTKIVTDEGESRERHNQALAGLGGLGAPVLPAIRSAAMDPDLTARERLTLGLGAAAIGDGALARDIATGLMDDVGESVDADGARLRVSDSPAEVTAATAMMALLTASIGDPVAPKFLRYVETDPSPELTTALPVLGAVDAALRRTAPKAASFAYALDGERHVIKLEPGGSHRMLLTPSQIRAVSIEPVDGQVAVTTTWRDALDPASLEAEPGVAISRRIEPGTSIHQGDLVVVDLAVDLPATAPAGCHPVTEVVPSGLVPISTLYQAFDPDDGSEPSAFVAPYAQAGQRLSFCADTTENGRRLRYAARVVTGGTYTWEPAILASRSDPDRAAMTRSSVIEID